MILSENIQPGDIRIPVHHDSARRTDGIAIASFQDFRIPVFG